MSIVFFKFFENFIKVILAYLKSLISWGLSQLSIHKINYK